MMLRSDKFFRWIEGLAAVALLIAIVILVAIASVARAWGSPIIWSVEIAQLLFVWLCVISADLALQNSRHFGLSVLHELLNARGRYWLDFFNFAVLAALLGFLLIYAWRNTELMHPRLFGATQMHGSWTHGAMLVGFTLMLRTILFNLHQLLTGAPIGAAQQPAAAKEKEAAS
ncbi:MAG: TRAP transporter small permease subunit [Rhodobacteraceae bacterium]|nr:TRAP transporter small permease subunit [Paracoccaceae bacterium]